MLSVGLLLCYQLQRLGVSTYLIDTADKASPAFPMYGRACTLFPRTSELLDQLDLYDELAQTALLVHNLKNYRDGKHTRSAGLSGWSNVGETFFDFFVNIRLKYSEDAFRKHASRVGGEVHAPVRLVDFVLDENAPDEYKITSVCRNLNGEEVKVRSKYIVGCDGGRSAVRTLAGIPFVGTDQTDQWVRIDGIVKTNVPDARTAQALIESNTHGLVLLAPLDHGATRVGYALSPRLVEKYGRSMSSDDAVNEAKAAVAPFELDFTRVNWHTVYVVKQHIADRLQDRERILLAGDAAHTHSSGSAQGMNTGVHDAVSLGWRLAGVLNGWYKSEVLETYTTERKAIAEQLINNDRTVASFASGKKPEKYKHRHEDMYVLAAEFYKDIQSFTYGLGISYAPNILNATKQSEPPIAATPGHRAPDALVQKAGSFAKTRLYEMAKNNGKFHVLIFTGRVESTRLLLESLRIEVDEVASPFEHAFDFITLVLGHGSGFEERLGLKHFGKGCWDTDSSAHIKYEISQDQGAIVVLRPDGILGFVAPLNGFDRVAGYFAELIVSRVSKKVVNKVEPDQAGEILSMGENNLTYRGAAKIEDHDIPVSVESGAVVA
jgi:phenol 2-monooxygenase (NADPH)